MRKCIYPQNILIVGNDGNTTSCPLENGNVKLESINDGILNAWNSSKYDTFRNNLESYLTNPGKACWQCNKLEKVGAISLRQLVPLLSDNVELRAIQFKLSNRCQLACAHCGPLLSSTWAKSLGITNYVNKFELKQEIIEELGRLVPNLDFIRFTGGEPWMDPVHWNILRHLKDVDKKNCELHYITNGLATFKSELWESWKRVHIIISVDGYRDAFEWFRRGAKWSSLMTAIEKLKKLKNVDYKINFSVTPWTINYLDEVEKAFSDISITGIPVMHPPHCSLASFTRDNYKSLGLAYYTKYDKIIGSAPRDLKLLKQWALQWDKKWGTEGWAEKLHPWLNDIH